MTYTCKLDVKKKLINTTFQLQSPRISTFQTPATHFNIDPRPCFSCSNCLLVPAFFSYFLDRSFNRSRGNNQRFNKRCKSKAMALSGLHGGYLNVAPIPVVVLLVNGSVDPTLPRVSWHVLNTSKVFVY